MTSETVERNEPLREQKWWQSPWVVGLSLALAVVSIAVTIYVYIASGAEKEPLYMADSTSLVEPASQSPQAIKILFGGRPVARVTSTTIRFWNAGKKTIESSDISDVDPVRIAIPPNVTVLRASIVKCSRPCMDAGISPFTDGMHISFSFMDRNDGCTMQILHTGSTEEKWKVVGTLKGSQPLRAVPIGRPEWFIVLTGVLVGIAAGLLFCVILMVGLLGALPASSWRSCFFTWRPWR